jgi:SAM-dependent methyltransferase
MDERLQSEQAFHDAQAAARRDGWQCDPNLFQSTSEHYLDHEPWIRPALMKLGPLADKRVLDFGCGHGMAGVVLAQHGASVTAFDLSSGYVHETAQRAEANGVAIHALVADGNRLPFACQSFDAIWGVAILHHLDIERAALEITRVLKPNGIAVFCEPWGGNKVLALARRHLPYRGKERTRDEEPLLPKHLAPFRTHFSRCQVEHVQFLGMIRRAWKSCPWLPVLDRWDSRLLRQWPHLSRWCRYVVLSLRP